MKSLIFFLIIIAIGVKAYSFFFLITLLVITFLIFFHELGHFLAARCVGVRVEVFSIGFGKPLYERLIGGTKYRLCALIFGGYVKLKGQDDLKPGVVCDEKDSYKYKSPLQRIFILIAGPAFNLILAFLLYFLVANLGVEKFAPVVGKVMPASAASVAGIKPGDIILSIGGKKLKTFDEISPLLKDKDQSIKILRDGVQKSFVLRPKLGLALNDFGQKIKKPMLGVTPSGKLVRLYFKGGSGLKYAYDESVRAGSLIFIGIKKMFTKEVSPSNLGGILTMVDVTSRASAASFVTLCLITALISINLGLLNLIPIPALDGGHILFNLYELIFKRPFPVRIFEILTYIGIAILLAIMVFATYNDFLRLQVAPFNALIP